MIAKAKLDQWQAAYTQHLAAVMKDHPDDYVYGITAEEIAAKARKSIVTKGLHAIAIPGSIGWRRTAQHFGIRNTYKEWEQWFANETTG
jgi:hypothetical protein